MRLTILGATGSIGASTIDLVRRHRDRLSCHALVGHRNVARMLRCIEAVDPELAVMTDVEAAAELAAATPGCRVEAGMEAAIAAACDPSVEMVVAAMVGAVGIPAALAAVAAGKRVGLANKECLVTAGRLFVEAAARSGAEIVPVDSEHAAVAQALAGQDRGSVTAIVLTASGGPFRDRDPASLGEVTPEEAVAHPNWSMGAKISVDSATMMNKALELIEARWLFDAAPEQLSAIIHPQSIVHALVHYRDGSVLAHLGMPDMRCPIAWALQPAPRLGTGVAPLDLAALGRLEFAAVDEERFPAMRLVRAVLAGGDLPAIVFNGANEEANAAFRAGRIRFPDIVAVVEEVLMQSEDGLVSSIEEVYACDRRARRHAQAVIAARDR
ncbi:MAG: 1-deoxy-D-xylulose-5-phosphate reductoisomerase [Zetaproteobacteria bacterium]|nr:MAG: 1-deoxy-D-xylulose-5-phosphate reductoisomerase [Zetaproteobacteria bacterium]